MSKAIRWSILQFEVLDFTFNQEKLNKTDPNLISFGIELNQLFNPKESFLKINSTVLIREESAEGADEIGRFVTELYFELRYEDGDALYVDLADLVKSVQAELGLNAVSTTRGALIMLFRQMGVRSAIIPAVTLDEFLNMKFRECHSE